MQLHFGENVADPLCVKLIHWSGKLTVGVSLFVILCLNFAV